METTHGVRPGAVCQLRSSPRRLVVVTRCTKHGGVHYNGLANHGGSGAIERGPGSASYFLESFRVIGYMGFAGAWKKYKTAERELAKQYEAGFRAGVSDIEADLDTLCDQLDIEYEGHPITALREEIIRLRGRSQ